MKQISETPPIDWLFYVEFRKTGLWVIALLCVLTLGGVLLQWTVFEDFFAGMVVGCLLMWLTLNFWARVFFGAADRAIGLQRMLLCAILGLPLGIIVTFGVVQYWPNGLWVLVSA